MRDDQRGTSRAAMLRAVISACAAVAFVACGNREAAATATPLATSQPTATGTATPDTAATYTVKSDDTAWDISLRFGITLEQLASANKTSVQDLSTIHVGDILTIPR